MLRHAWIMKLKPGQEAEYRRKHDEIWPEMVDLLKRQGVRNYTIYQNGLTLFAYYERDGEAPAIRREADPIELRWRKWMEPHMETLADATPVVEPLVEIFRLD